MSKFAFFRQSGWMVIATSASGVFMVLVHRAATWPPGGMPDDQYSLFATFLQVLNFMSIPSVALQMTLVQQTVAAEAQHSTKSLVGAFRALMGGTFLLWLAGCTFLYFAQDQIVRDYRLTNPALIWVTAGLGLFSLWTPITLGILQGRQNFLWLGWVAMLTGAIRLGGVFVLVRILGGHATGAMTGALLGMAAALAIAAWHTRDLWRGESERFAWASWLKRMLPITLGYGAATYMLLLDMIVVRRFFTGLPGEGLQGAPGNPGDETALYGAAGTFGRAVFFFLAPLTTVMFPKIAQSAVKSEKTNVLAQAVGVTALMGVGAGLFCTFFVEYPFRLIFPESYKRALELIPLFAWCMLPLPLANVLINNLLARERYAVVPWLTVIAVAYYFALTHAAQIQPRRFENIIWTLGGFGLLLLITCICFTVLENRRTAQRR